MNIYSALEQFLDVPPRNNADTCIYFSNINMFEVFNTVLKISFLFTKPGVARGCPTNTNTNNRGSAWLSDDVPRNFWKPNTP